MEFNEVVTTRRSIRRYEARPVAQKDIEAMIQCAMEAPSWKNSQTARYHIITSSDMLNKMKTEGLAPFNAENSKDAPVLIITTFVRDCSGYDKDGTPSNELGNLWGAYDLGLHNENLLLKARDLGLDTLVMGIRDATLYAVCSIYQSRKSSLVLSVWVTGQYSLKSQSVKLWRKLSPIIRIKEL